MLNQSPPVEDYNTFATDQALKESVIREGANWALEDLHTHGTLTGSRRVIQFGYQANENRPVLKTHNRHGHRIDEVQYHPAYHELMEMSCAAGLHSSPWAEQRPGAHVARAATYYLQAQAEAGHGCPITMTFACIPTLKLQSDLAEQWIPLVTHRGYDSRNVPFTEKSSVTMGMAMTEKQGGSDVRANATEARSVEGSGPGRAYELFGHKYFVSAPMSDAFLTLAQAPAGLSCFLVPRWRPNGSKNPLEIQQLKVKMGNVSNACAEMELRNAMGWLVDEEGRGVANIIEMVAHTRFDCMIGSSAGMRQAVTQITHHCHHREAFGHKLDNQPLMQNVLADLILESEAALALTMRTARTLDNRLSDEHEAALFRVLAPIGKYWICKRTPAHAYEAMECIGGSGVIEDHLMARLYREAPINPIWEGSGNVQCLDLFRAMGRQPDTVLALIDELKRSLGQCDRYDRFTARLLKEFDELRTWEPSDMEYRARDVVGRTALALQASVLLQGGNAAVAEAFCLARLGSASGFLYGNLPKGIDCAAIIERARPDIAN